MRVSVDAREFVVPFTAVSTFAAHVDVPWEERSAEVRGELVEFRTSSLGREAIGLHPTVRHIMDTLRVIQLTWHVVHASSFCHTQPPQLF